MTRAQALDSCALTAGLPADGQAQALRLLAAKTGRYLRGQTLHGGGAPLARFGLVLEGIVQVCMEELDGRLILMASVGEGETFGESLCYLGQPTDVRIVALTGAVVLWLDPARLRQSDPDPLAEELRRRFTAMLAQRTLAMNDRIQILSRHGLRARLITFFSQYARRWGRQFTVPFDRASLAAYLGVDRSALSRELSRMQKEGLLQVRKNHFTLLFPADPPQ